jgi:hypothetical protein
MILLALLTGGIIALVWAGKTRWYEIVLLGGWGLLAAGTSFGGPPLRMLQATSSALDGWFH